MPRIVGAEGAGTVLQGAGDFAAGAASAWAAAAGSYAERAAVPVAQAAIVPDGTSAEQAAAVILQGMTAHYLSAPDLPVQRDDVALVHAAAGGVGLLLVQMIKALGGCVMATTSSEAKMELRARRARTRRSATRASATRCASSRAAPHVIYDAIGETTFEESIDALRPRGLMVLYGMASGPAPAYDPQGLQAELALPHASGAARVRGHARGAALERRRRSAGSRTARSTYASVSATCSRTRGAPTRTSRRAAAPEN